MRCTRIPLAAAACLVGLGVLLTTSAARADDEAADGPDACRAFIAKNERERAAYEKTQDAVPYEYPRDDNVLEAPWGKLFDALGGPAGGLLLASIIPHAGAQLRGDQPAAVISLPWSLPFGPAFSCSRKPKTLAVRVHRAHRFVLEPGVSSGKRGTGFWTRPAYRFLYHPSEWVVGVGFGLGSTIEIAGQREPTRFSASPEALIHFGHCCEPSYFTLAVRYDRFFGGNVSDVLGASLGYTFF